MYPTYVEVNGVRYNINTNFKIGIKCDEIGRDETIPDEERALAIIYLLFGEQALKDIYNHQELKILALKYLSCNKEIEETNEKEDMSFTEDYDYIEASFMSDYGINLEEEDMHWWKFCKLINGLSNSEFGNCCVLNKIRNLRNLDTSQIKDLKERQKLEKAKQRFALKKKPIKKREFNKEEIQNMNNFFETMERS